MSTTTDILILGGGIVGLAIAIELKLKGASVTILSRDFQQAATHAAAGMLAPEAEALSSGSMLDLCLWSRSLYPDWIHKLEAIAGCDTGYWNCGILAPLYEVSEEIGVNGEKSGGSPSFRWLDQTAIHQQQPGLSSEVMGGWWFPEDAQVDNRALAQALQVAAQDLGVNLCEGVTVQAIQKQNQQVTGIETSEGNCQAGHYILATGAWSSELMPVPVYPRKGQMLAVKAPVGAESPLQQVLYGSHIYIVPRRDGRIIIGATSEDVGFLPYNTAAGVQTLLAEAIRLFQPLRDLPLQECWWGFRPATPDELPILGSSPWKNLTYATGHYRNGILLAPVTALLIANLALHQQSDPLLTHFHFSRFVP